jgi:signal transduction histidine kinase
MRVNHNQLQSRLKYHLLQTQLEIQHEKLKEASSTLFNNIGQALVCIRLGLLKAAQQYSDTELEQNSKQLAQIIKDLRELNSRLDPEEILKKGITSALEEELEKLTRDSAIRTRIQQTGQPFNLSTEATFIVFRMLQECMQIAVQHTQPQNLLLCILYTKEHAVFSLKDDGRQPETLAPLQDPKFLHTLEERARLADAVLQVESTPEYGSHVTIKLSKTK